MDMLVNPEVIVDIRKIISAARDNAVKTIDRERVLMYWNIGKRIFEEEQQGKERAGYGEYLIKQLSAQLQPEFGTGMSMRNLKLCRQFYRAFPIGLEPLYAFGTHYLQHISRIQDFYPLAAMLLLTF